MFFILLFITLLWGYIPNGEACFIRRSSIGLAPSLGPMPFDEKVETLSIEMGKFLAPLDLFSGPSMTQITSEGGLNLSIVNDFTQGVGMNPMVEASTIMIQTLVPPQTGQFILVKTNAARGDKAKMRVQVTKNDFSIIVRGEKNDKRDAPSMLTHVNGCEFVTPVNLKGYISVIQIPLNGKEIDLMGRIASNLFLNRISFQITPCMTMTFMTPTSPIYVAVTSMQPLEKALGDIDTILLSSFI